MHAIIDNKGIIYDGSLDEMMTLWENDDTDYTDVSGDLMLVEILDRK